MQALEESETNTSNAVGVGIGIALDTKANLADKKETAAVDGNTALETSADKNELDDGGFSEEVNQENVAARASSETTGISNSVVGVGIAIFESDLMEEKSAAFKNKAGVDDATTRDKSSGKTEGDKSQQRDHHEDDDPSQRTSIGQDPLPQLLGPGAHATGGNLADGRAGMRGSEHHGSTTHDPSIPVANLVHENEQTNVDDLPRATRMTTRLMNAKDTWHRELRILAMGAIGLLVVISVIVVTMLLVGDQNPDNEGIATPITEVPVPSEAPTVSIANYYLSLLPDYSVRSVQDDPESPQAQAFEWLLEDVDSHNIVFEDWRIHQRFALASLYYATGGDQWQQRDNWLNHTVHECAWHSEVRTLITKQLQPMCNQAGVIFNLGLARNNLRNTLPPELFLLTSLQSLGLEYNRQLQGPIPEQVGELTALTRLWIHNTQQGGTIPSQVGRLTNLQALSLAGNGHTGSLPSEFSLLTNLQTLVLGQNDQLTGSVLTTLVSLPQLGRFSVDNNDHSGTIPEEVGQLSNLLWLLLAGNRFHGTVPSTIGLLSSNILVLSLNRNQFEGVIPTELGLLTASTLLSLHTNNFLSTLPSELGNLSNLTLALTLQKNPLLGGTLPTQLGCLTGLYALDFGENNHTGYIPSELGLLTSLGKLDLSNNGLSGTIPEALHALNQSLYYLDVHGNALLSGSVPRALCQINATCIPSQWRGPCIPAEGIHLAFDKTSLQCACDCHNETA